jgi:adenine-specific DNA-methyltransferase
MIYIDPPYNTGNEFIYPDDYGETLDTYLKYTGQKDEEGNWQTTNRDTDGRFHSRWLNMMYPRLFLAKNLLRDDGVIFISIDDHEVDNLKKMCSEIYGEENFIGKLTWIKKRKGSFLSQNLVSLTEYILIYSRAAKNSSLFGGKPDSSESQPLIKRTNSISTLEIPENVIKTKLSDGIYESGIYGHGSSSVELLHDTKVKNKVFIQSVKIKGPFIWSQKYLEEQLAEGAELVINTDNFQVRAFKADDKERFKGLSSLIDGVKIKGTNEDGYEELRDILGQENLIDYPKPKNLIKYLVKAGTYFNDDDIVLDFFAGSASTAHATIELNQEENKDMKSIMVQLPELIDEDSEAKKAGFDTIADIGKERIRRVIKELKNEKEENSQQTELELEEEIEDQKELDLGFKVFKLDKSNFNVWEAPEADTEAEKLEDQLDVFADHITPEAERESILYELILKSGYPLSTKITQKEIDGHTVYIINEGALLIYLDEGLTFEILEKIAEMEPNRIVCLDKSFTGGEADALKTNAVQLFKANDITFRRV